MMTMSRNFQKPYPNYHAARIKSPGLFASIKVLNTSKEGIMFYGGPLKSNPSGASKIQTIRFPKDKFSAEEAKEWLKDHKYSPIKFESASEKEAKAVWTTAYMNDLADSCFLYIESGGKKDDSGKTKPRSLRHFPYKDKSGKIDLAHLRNAIAQAPKSNLPKSVQDSVQAKARKILEQQTKMNKALEALWPSISDTER